MFCWLHFGQVRGKLRKYKTKMKKSWSRFTTEHRIFQVLKDTEVTFRISKDLMFLKMSQNDQVLIQFYN